MSAVRCYELTDGFRVGATLEQTWAFFSSAKNLPEIRPPWLGFTIHTPESITIQKDTIFDYTIRWMKIPVKWKTRIIEWDQPRRFADLQTGGPYALWYHEHAFEPDGHGGVRCSDRVVYRLPFGPVGRLTHAMLVKNQLDEIFHHRRRTIAKHLGGISAAQENIEFRTVAVQREWYAQHRRG